MGLDPLGLQGFPIPFHKLIRLRKVGQYIYPLKVLFFFLCGTRKNTKSILSFTVYFSYIYFSFIYLISNSYLHAGATSICVQKVIRFYATLHTWCLLCLLKVSAQAASRCIKSITLECKPTPYRDACKSHIEMNVRGASGCMQEVMRFYTTLHLWCTPIPPYIYIYI